MDTSLPAPSSPFRPALRIPLLLMPFLFVLPVLYEFGTGDAVARGYATWFKPFHDLLMLHTIHLIFPFMLIVLQKDLRALIFDRDKKYTFPIVAGSALVFFGWIGLLAINRFWAWSLILNGMAMAIFPAVHAVNQSFGMLYILNRASNTPHVEALIRLERRATAHVLLSGIAAQLCNVALHIWPARYDLIVDVRWACVAYSMAWALRIILVNLRMKEVGAEKKIFSFRYVFFPLCAVSTAALLCVGAFHAYEYLAIFDKGLRRTTARSRAAFRLVVGGGSALIAALVLITFFNQPQPTSGGTPGWLYTVAAQFLGGLAMAHYYIDAHLYKFRNADFKKLYGNSFFVPWSQTQDDGLTAARAGDTLHAPAKASGL